MARNRRSSGWRLLAAIAIPAVVVGYVVWPESIQPSNDSHPTNEPSTEPDGVASAPTAPAASPTSSPVAAAPLTSAPAETEPVLTLAASPAPSIVTNRGLGPALEKPVPSPEGTRRAADHLDKAKRAEEDNKLLAARDHYNHALDQGLPAEQEQAIRRSLFDIADKTIFSPRRVPGDPLTGTHVIASGENLDRIARKYKVTAGLLARINRLPNANVIRAGQPLKVVHGPFHARVDKGSYILWVYLQDVLVASYPVGLGENGKTPTGNWRIKSGNKLLNPTFFDPFGGPTIAADDPKNPLGEHWIGLEGVSGDAVGKDGFGIHGTIEPDSIGKSESLGCVRLHNKDVTQLFDLLVPVHSQVIIRP